jgi:hypothetical protein
MVRKKEKSGAKLPTRRNNPQLRFEEADYQRLVKLAMQKGCIDLEDIGNLARVKAKVEKMIISELLGSEKL